MAITFPALEPTVKYPANKPYPEIRAFPNNSSATYTRGQLVNIASGTINVVATNPANVIGLALNDAGAVFQNPSGQAVVSSLFGTGSNLQTPLWNTDLNLGLVVMAHNGQEFEFTFNQALPNPVYSVIGTTVGFTLTSGIFLADSTVGNKIGIITDLVTVPVNIIGTGAETMYAVGDINTRVIVQITSGLTI